MRKEMRLSLDLENKAVISYLRLRDIKTTHSGLRHLPKGIRQSLWKVFSDKKSLILMSLTNSST
jgi:hypothetical protein